MDTQLETLLQTHSGADDSTVLTLVDTITASLDVPTIVRAVNICLSQSPLIPLHNSVSIHQPPEHPPDTSVWRKSPVHALEDSPGAARRGSAPA